MCINENCPYKVHYGVINTTQFEKSGNQCKICGSDGKYVPCHARRYISYGKRKVKVFHQGNHTCQPIVKTTRNVQKIKELVKNNPNIKPAEIQSTIVLSAFRNQMDWQTVEKEAASIVNRKQITNIKQKIRAETEPHGHNFEAIVNFKEYCDEKDKLYVYKINDRRGNPDQPSSVFKSSEAKMKLAVAMNNEKDDFLSEQFCFFDGKHNRCRGFVTLTGSVYHPLLRKQIPIAIMEAENETTENVELFWKLFNETISKASNGNCTSFNPIGLCTDMAGANLAGIVNVFGVDAKKRIKSCEFHFKDLRNKKAQRLDIDSAKEFKTLCDELLRSTTVAAYEAAKRQLDTFIAADSDRDFLTTWISWWHERRGFIFHAFAPTNAPKMNQAVVVHAGWANRDRPNMSLLDACHADVRDSLLVEMEL